MGGKIEEEIRKRKQAALEKSRNRTLPNYPLKNKVLSKEEWLLNLDRR